MGALADNIMGILRERTADAMNAAGHEIAANIQRDLDTPYPPASAPGTPPHRRTGNLQAGVGEFQAIEAGTVRQTITSDRADGDPNVPAYLEFGTVRMAPRPYMGPAKNAAQESVLADVAERMRLP